MSTVLGFTEIGGDGRLWNAAAVVHKGRVAGVYRKLYPAIRKSVYEAGDRIPVFTIGDLTFGILICLDSTHEGPARITRDWDCRLGELLHSAIWASMSSRDAGAVSASR